MRSIVTVFGILILLNISISAQATVQVKIENGIVEGITNTQKGLKIFLGIPYAEPPMGELRWKAPQPKTDWKGILETKKFGPRPVQTNVWGDMIYRSGKMSEDCLYLNVWSPNEKGDELLPVLVYFYGGGFVAGDGSEPRYDGAAMASKGIVTLTVNYRLNIFGFFAHPELSAEAPYKASGNYGLLDQHLALQWVKDNIEAFGGDPEKVTIAGESAGSISVSSHMASPLSKNLIAGAIGESGAAIHPTLSPVPLAEAEQTGKEFAENTGYNSLAQLRELTTEEIFKIYNDSKRFGFPTVVDGYFYTESLPDIFNTGEQAQIPLLLGWNSAEMTGMAFMYGMPYTKENFVNKVKENYPDDFDEVLTLYKHSNNDEVERSATQLASDRFIVYSTWKWFDLHRKNSEQHVYRYLFSKLRPPLKDKSKAMNIPKAIGAPHACEIEYCMGNLPLIDVYEWTDEDYKVSETMMNYFANFIKTGDPNGEDLPGWLAAEPDDSTPPVMIIDVESYSEEAGNDVRFQFHDRYYGNSK